MYGDFEVIFLALEKANRYICAGVLRVWVDVFDSPISARPG